MARQNSLAVEAVVEGLAAVGEALDSVIVVIPCPLFSDDLDSMLDLDKIAGLMLLPDSAADFRSDPRVGCIPHSGEWVLPAVTAQGLMILGHPDALAMMWLKEAMHRGLRSCLWMEADGRWRRRSLRFEFARQVARRLIIRGGRRWLDARRDGPGWHSMERRLGRLLAWSHRQDSGESDKDEETRQGIMQVTATLGAGGAERQLVRLANCLTDKGYPLTILCQSPPSGQAAFFKSAVLPRIPVHRLRCLAETVAGLSDSERSKLQRKLIVSGGSQLARALPAALVDDVLRYLAEFLVARPAVVHLWQDYTNVAAGVAAVFADVPCIVLSQRSLAPARFQYAQSFLRPLYRFLADQPRVVITNNSQVGAIDYARWLGIDSARIRVVYNGVDDNMERASPEAMDAWLRRHGMAGGSPVVGGVLRLSEEKNPLLWLETVSLVAKQHPRLLAILIGSGPMRQDVIDHAQTLGLTGRLHLVESEPDVSLAISAMDVLLLTSRVEGTPNVLLEAGLLGCPVVTTGAGGCVEAVKDGVTGWVVGGAIADTLAERVCAVLDNPAWRHRAAKEAPCFVREKFGSARMLSEVIHCYHSARDPLRFRPQTSGRAGLRLT